MKKNRSLSKSGLVVFLVLVLALFLRLAYLPEKLSFLYDQGRDALVVKGILDGKLTLLGPATDIPGVFHGAAHYYWITPGYWLAGGHPMGAVLIYLSVNVLAVFLLFKLGKAMFGRKVGFLAAVLMATSYGAIGYSRWLSNPSPVPFLMTLLVFGLYKIAKGKQNYLVLVALCWALVFHAEVVGAVFLVPFLAPALWLLRPKIKNRKVWLKGAVTVFITLSPYLLFELRHQFLMTTSAARFFFGGKNLSFAFSAEPFEVFLKEFGFWLLPFRINYSTVLFILSLAVFLYCLLTSAKKSEKLSLLAVVLWLLGTPLFLVFYGHAIHPHFFLGAGPAMILLVAYFFSWLWGKGKLGKFLSLLAFSALVGNNLIQWKEALPVNRGVVFYGAGTEITFADQTSAVDYICRDAGGRPFRYEALGVPYFLDHAWRYLFAWYGRKEYHCSPDESADLVYYLVEDIDSPEFQLFAENWLIEKSRVANLEPEIQVQDVRIIKGEEK